MPVHCLLTIPVSKFKYASQFPLKIEVVRYRDVYVDENYMSR